MATGVSDRESVLRDLRERFLDRAFGAVRVLALGARVGPDHTGELSLYVDVTLNDPSGDTWALADTQALARAIRDWLSDKGLGLLVYVRLSPKTVPPDDDDPGDA